MRMHAAALFLLLSPLSAAAQSASYYVSPEGNDSWSGTLPDIAASGIDGPFLTLARAQQAMRSSGLKTTVIRAGTYSIASGLVFAAPDAGETWIPFGNESVIIDGGGTGFIRASRVDRLTFEGLTFRNLGVNPRPYSFPFVIFASSHYAVRWNRFLNCRYSCLFGVNTSDAIVDSNVFDGQSPGNPPGDVGHFFSVLSFTNGSNDIRITHNLIRNAQGGAISIISGAQDKPNNNGQVDRNLIQNVNTAAVDAGAIYVLDRTHAASGVRVTNNIIERVGGSGSKSSWSKSIYLDDLTSNVVVSGNLCRGGSGEYAIHIHGGDHNLIENNIFDLENGSLLGFYQGILRPHALRGTPAIGARPGPSMTANTFTRNIVYSQRVFAGPLWSVNRNDPGAVMLRNIGNLYYSAGDSAAANSGPAADVRPLYADPHFVDPASNDFAMQVDSPAYRQLGLHPLATDQGPLPPPALFQAPD